MDGINNLMTTVPVRDAFMVFTGLSYSEEIALRWEDVGGDPAAAGGVGGADFRTRK